MENPAEVQELRNKLRMMKLPQDEILNTVRKQQRAIHKQKQANDTIRNEITEYETQISNLDKAIEKFKNDETLQRLQTQKKNLTNKLSILTADYAAEEAKRKKLEDDVSKANSEAGGLYQQSRENEERQARLRTMENRLDKALVRYNKNLTKLADMRAQIDELRKDRFTFKSVIKNAENEGLRKDEEIGNLITASNRSYFDRDRLKMDLVQLKQAEAEDIKNFEEEYKRLSQQIEGQKITQSHPHDQQNTVPSINSQLGSQNDQQEELTQLTDQYQGTINQTLELLGYKDVQELIEEADKIERENFSLFNFVVEHGSKRTKLQDEIDGLEIQHQSLLAQIETSDNEQKGDLNEITEEIKSVNSVLKEVNDQQEQNEAEASSIYQEIEGLFNDLGCSWDHTPDEKTNITQVNAMFCLSSVETALADMINEVVEKTKMQCNIRGISDYNQLLNEDQSDSASGAQTKAHQKVIADNVPKQFEQCSKPLSAEEMRAMLA